MSKFSPELNHYIPDVRDGLTVLQRRIIYGMYCLGLSPKKPFRKSAKIVGDVMGNFHPFGDFSAHKESFGINLSLLGGSGISSLAADDIIEFVGIQINREDDDDLPT